MGEILTILDFDETYDLQVFPRGHRAERIDLRDLGSASRFCSQEAFAEIRRRLGANPDRRLAFLGSGNRHYVTAALARGFSRPFTLVVFDHHTDLLEEPAPDLLSCGGWIRKLLAEEKNLRRVLLVGADLGEGREIPEVYLDRVEAVPGPFPEASRGLLADKIPTADVYLSIDKDVLDPADAETDWDQGNMSLDELLGLISVLLSGRHVLAADVCGEPPRSDRLSEDRRAAEKNGRTNRRILETILPFFARKR